MGSVRTEHLEQILLNMTGAIMTILPDDTNHKHAELTIRMGENIAEITYDNKQTRVEHQVRQRKLNEKVQEIMTEKKKQLLDRSGHVTDSSMRDKVVEKIKSV